jgi:hypothetical protein
MLRIAQLAVVPLIGDVKDSLNEIAMAMLLVLQN